MGRLGGPPSQGHKGLRHSAFAAREIHPRHQPENRESARHGDIRVTARQCRQGDRVETTACLIPSWTGRQLAPTHPLIAPAACLRSSRSPMQLGRRYRNFYCLVPETASTTLKPRIACPGYQTRSGAKNSTPPPGTNTFVEGLLPGDPPGCAPTRSGTLCQSPSLPTPASWGF
jgi:hypothetical protein